MPYITSPHQGTGAKAPVLFYLKGKDMERFWNKVQKLPGVDACWIWIAGKDRYGYGQFKLDGKVLRAHQVSWKIEKGEWAPYLCHTCDNRACVNPAHLYPGNSTTNKRDQVLRGRGWAVKYPDHLIRRVRREYFVGLSSYKIAAKYSIPKETVKSILNGDIRKHAGGPIRDRGTRYLTNAYGTGRTGVKSRSAKLPNT